MKRNPIRTRRLLAAAALAALVPGPAAAVEFQVAADSLTVVNQVNVSSVGYFQGQATAPGAPGSATQLASPGGLYFDGTYYKVWDAQAGAWVRLATGTVESGRVAKAGDFMSGQLTTESTITVKGSAFSVGGSSFVVAGDKVGVGLASPATALDVAGRVNTSQNYSISGSTVLSVRNTGTLSVGVDAGRVNTASYNVFVGSAAGYSNASGQEHVFLGWRAGYSNTSGTRNIFVGPSAGDSNTTGSDNYFIGNGAGYSNTTASNNIFVGANAGSSNTAGAWNVMLGQSAGFANTSGGNNTFVGMLAGDGNTTGGSNVFVGRSAGDSNSTGSNNTFLGVRAAGSNSTASSNTALGYEAGFSNATGKQNVFLGFEAGYSEKGSDKLYIANSRVNPALLYGDFAAGRVGVSTQAPQARLDVDGDAQFGSGAAKSTFTAAPGGTTYALLTSSGINVGGGPVFLNAGGFIRFPDGTAQVSASAVDNTKVAKAGDGMAGPLTVSGSSVTIINSGSAEGFSLAVTSAADRSVYHLYVSTQGLVGIGTSSPGADPLTIRKDIAGGFGHLRLENLQNAANNDAGVDFVSANASGSPVRSLNISSFISNRTAGAEDGGMIIRTTLNGDPTNKRIVIDGEGDVVIGNQFSGNNLLTVDGEASVGAAYRTVNAPSNGLIVEGLVGVGASAPGARLEVKQAASDGYAVRVSSNDGAGTFVVDRKGNVGVGTTAPATKLHMSSGTLTIDGDNGTPFQVNGSTFVITSGNVGIGTSNLNRSGAARTLTISDTSGGAYSYLELVGNRTGNNGTVGGVVVQNESYSGSSPGKIIAMISGATSNPVDLRVGELVFMTRNNSDNLGSRMRITGAGNVGINTGQSGVPATRLEVNGDAQFGSGAAKSTFTAAPGGTTYALLTSSGINVGGGPVFLNAGGFIRFPDGTAQVSASAVDNTKVAKAGDGMTGPLTVSGSSVTIINSGTSQGFSLAVTSAADRSVYHLYVSTQGLVGINQSNPVDPLQVRKDRDGASFVSMINGNNTANARTGFWAFSATSEGGVAALPAGHTLFGTHFADRLGLIAPDNATAASGQGAAGVDVVAIDAAGDIRLYTGGIATSNERLRVGSTGNVGVGTASPAAKLDVAGDAQFGSGAAKSTFTAAGNLQFVSGSTIAANGTLSISTAASAALTGTPALFVDKAGGVGIGTSVVQGGAALAVNGPVFTGSGRVGDLFFGGGGWPYSIGTGWDAQNSVLRFNAVGTSGGTADFRDFRIYDGKSNPILEVEGSTKRVSMGGNEPSPDAMLEVVQNAGAPMLMLSASVAGNGDLAIVDGSGRLGLGTTGPGARLEVKQAAGDGYAVRVSSNDGAGMFVIDRTGNVGVGTTSPATNSAGRNLHVAGTGPSLVLEETDAAADNKFWDVLVNAEQFRGRAVNDAGSVDQDWLLVNRTGGAVDNVNFPNGSVGISTTGSGGKLVVKGEGNTIRILADSGQLVFDSAAGGSQSSLRSMASGFTVQEERNLPLILATNGAEQMRITGAGDVGIGAVPSTKMHVQVAGAGEGYGLRIAATDIGRWRVLNPGVDNALEFGTIVSNDIHFITDNLSRAKIGFDGNVQFGRSVTNGSFQLDIGGTGTGNAVCHSGTAAATDGVDLVDCTSAPSADYAELYPVEEGIGYGEIVVTGTGGKMVPTFSSKDGVLDRKAPLGRIAQLIRSVKPYQAGILGITSNNYSDFTSAGYNLPKGEHALPVALNGRVPLKVSTESGPIRIGDLVTSSSLAGTGMKAVAPGMTAGIALEGFDGTGPEAVACGKHRCGRILVFVNPAEGNVAGKIEGLEKESLALREQIRLLKSMVCKSEPQGEACR